MPSPSATTNSAASAIQPTRLAAWGVRRPAGSTASGRYTIAAVAAVLAIGIAAFFLPLRYALIPLLVQAAAIAC